MRISSFHQPPNTKMDGIFLTKKVNGLRKISQKIPDALPIELAKPTNAACYGQTQTTPDARPHQWMEFSKTLDQLHSPQLARLTLIPPSPQKVPKLTWLLVLLLKPVRHSALSTPVSFSKGKTMRNTTQRPMLKRPNSTRMKLNPWPREKHCGLNSKPLLDMHQLSVMMTAKPSSKLISSRGVRQSMRLALKTKQELPAVKPRRSRRTRRLLEPLVTKTTTQV